MHRDPILVEADAYTARGDMLQAARDAFATERTRELTRAFAAMPLSFEVDANWAWGRGPVPVAQELAGWVRETIADADATMAEAMFSDIARQRLVRAFIDARVEMEADQLLARGGL